MISLGASAVPTNSISSGLALAPHTAHVMFFVFNWSPPVELRRIMSQARAAVVPGLNTVMINRYPPIDKLYAKPENCQAPLYIGISRRTSAIKQQSRAMFPNTVV